MSADRELLELAAKAAALDYHIDHIDGCPKIVTYGAVFNPLLNDGQALILAVRLKLEICFEGRRVAVRHSSGVKVLADLGDNQFAAVRRAIVRAAAEIGKSAGSGALGDGGSGT